MFVMSDQHTPQHPPRSISEISHLFLSSVRESHSRGMPTPVRVPPSQQPQQPQPEAQQPQHPPLQRTDMTIDLTPEEFAHVFGDEKDITAAQTAAQPSADQSAALGKPLRAVLASHLGAQQLARVHEYAAHLCQPGQRIGLIAVDASEFRLSIFEHQPHPHPHAGNHESLENDVFDPRKMSEALDELAWDVDEWLLFLPSPRAPEARAMLRDVARWTLLTTCDHDGVVSCYRTLKGLSDLHRPQLSLATIEPHDDADGLNAYQRLASVCRQFLDWSLTNEAPVAPSQDVTEHIVLWCCATRDKAQLATAPQWQVVADFLARNKVAQPAAPAITAERHAAPTAPRIAKPQAEPAPVVPISAASSASAPVMDTSEVIDLPDASENPAAIVGAVLRGGHELVECPVKPPMCPDASLAVSRDRHLVLVAVARQGLSDLRDIGRAYQWLIENRALIVMAVPQMSIDAHQFPRLHLLVDHADMSAQVLQPIMQSSSVTVHAYRKLRWAGKTGLLLEAA
jgi:hypothetical protein